MIHQIQFYINNTAKRLGICTQPHISTVCPYDAVNLPVVQTFGCEPWPGGSIKVKETFEGREKAAQNYKGETKKS